MTRLRRITIDRDSHNVIKNLFFIKRTLKFMSGKEGERIVITRSNSKGYHVVLWTRAPGNKFKIKNYCGNDKIQTRLDMKHQRGRQTLFYRKRKLIKFRRIERRHKKQ